MGNQICIFSKFNISKKYFWTFIRKFKRFPLKCSNFANFWSWMQHPRLKWNIGCRQTYIFQSVISELTLCGGGEGGRGGQQKYGILPLFGTYFSTTPLYLHTERFSLGTEEGIRKLYFDNKNWKNNEAHIPVEIRVLKTSFSKGRIWTVHSLSIQLIPDWIGDGRPRKWVLDDSSKKTDTNSGHIFLPYNPNSSSKRIS